MSYIYIDITENLTFGEETCRETKRLMRATSSWYFTEGKIYIVKKDIYEWLSEQMLDQTSVSMEKRKEK